MDWIKENRFYAGYAAVMLVGILALGFWVFKGWSGYNAALNDYKSTDGSVRKLADEKIFPSQDHLDGKEAMVARYAAAVDALQSEAGNFQRDLKSGYSEQEFRNLRNTETKAVVELASETGMQLPKDFALGFNSYNKGVGIPAHAVSILEWEFDAIKKFVQLAAESGLDSLDEFKRDKIAQENPEWKPEGAAPPKGRKPPRRSSRKPPLRGKRGRGMPPMALVDVNNPMATATTVMSTYRFMAKVSGSYESLTALLNKIASEENFFMWLRRVRIENEQKLSPRIPNDLPKTIKVPQPGAIADEGGAVPELDVEVDAEVIFGNEKMKAILVIDLVRFKEGQLAGGTDAPAETSP